ncbi:MAG: hypothetical protein OEL20_04665 [Sulfuritalea sp.]|nr:hypothetical protein [Sulfuritalea sp.]
MTIKNQEWTPSYSPWRHGGWYVNNVKYPNGACGCVSSNYPDKKWRIACDGRPNDYTFPTRDAAAKAELELVKAISLRAALVHAIEASGYSVSGPTDLRAAENGEPAWVCNARAVLAETQSERTIAAAIHRRLGIDDGTEVLPGATHQEIAEIMMQDIVGDYDVPEQVPEWVWVEQNASFNHVRNGQDGIWEFVLNLSRHFEEIPVKLAPVIAKARQANVGYLIFHQGT